MMCVGTENGLGKQASGRPDLILSKGSLKNGDLPRSSFQRSDSSPVRIREATSLDFGQLELLLLGKPSISKPPTHGLPAPIDLKPGKARPRLLESESWASGSCWFKGAREKDAGR